MVSSSTSGSSRPKAPQAQQQQQQQPQKSIGAEFVCRVKFQNNLPEISIGPKFMIHDNSAHAKKLVPWVLTDLEREYPYHVHDENPLASIPIDLLHLDRYEPAASQSKGN